MLGVTIAMTSDAPFGAYNDPTESYNLLSRCGWKGVMHCNEWDTQHIYIDEEVNHIASVLKNNGQVLVDTHASDAAKQHYPWTSSYKYRRQSGLLLIENRMWFSAKLGAPSITLHAPIEPDVEKDPAANAAFWAIMDDNLNQLVKWGHQYGVQVAFEQTDTTPMNMPTLLKILARTESDADIIGFCWDTGHGHIHNNNWSVFPLVQHRIKATHINGNWQRVPAHDPDVHMPPFEDGNTGVDWVRFVGCMRDSDYTGPFTVESGMFMYRGDIKLANGEVIQRPRMSVEDYLVLAREQTERLYDMYRNPNA